LFGILICSIILAPATAVQAFSFSAEINESFTPLAIVAGQTSRLDINIYNPNSFQLDNASFSDSLIGCSQVSKLPPWTSSEFLRRYRYRNRRDNHHFVKRRNSAASGGFHPWCLYNLGLCYFNYSWQLD